ncbi:MAG TPA: hypothetical protein PKA81_07595 [Clostridia bacterium]|nr:hypothetical protein [Clostridia bacterium]
MSVVNYNSKNQVTGSGAGQIKQLYAYDASGNLVSVNYNGTEYYYMFFLQISSIKPRERLNSLHDISCR